MPRQREDRLVSSRLRRRAPLVLIALAAAAIALPLGAFAAHRFADVPDDNPFHADIDALADSKVTSGCGGGNFCPSANVTREQMAAFLNRLGALAPGKTPVVNAKTAQTAGDADKLDGLDSTAFLRTTDTIDADTLGGKSASAFLEAGPIVHTYGTSLWSFQGPADPNVTLVPWADRATWVGAGAADFSTMLSPTVPTSEHGVAYALQSVTYCTSGAPESYVTTASVQGFAPALTGTLVTDLTDATDRTAPGCHTLTDASPTAAEVVTLLLEIHLDAATELDVLRTTFTWVPLAAG